MCLCLVRHAVRLGAGSRDYRDGKGLQLRAENQGCRRSLTRRAARAPVLQDPSRPALRLALNPGLAAPAARPKGVKSPTLEQCLLPV